MSQWFLLIIAGVCEALFAVFLGKAQEEKSYLSLYWLGFVVFLGISMYLLHRATSAEPNPIPMGIAYAVWTGIGAACTVVGSYFFLNQPLRPAQILFLVLLVVSVIGLKYSTAS